MGVRDRLAVGPHVDRRVRLEPQRGLKGLDGAVEGDGLLFRDHAPIVSPLTAEVNTLTAGPCNGHAMLRTLNERARKARERAGFRTPAEAADAIGCSRPTVIRWETDPSAKSISGDYLNAAARAYAVHPDWLAMLSDDDRYPWSETAGQSEELRALREEVRGLKAIFAASLSVMARHRPLEATALATALEEASSPSEFVREVLAVLGPPGAGAAPPGRSAPSGNR